MRLKNNLLREYIPMSGGLDLMKMINGGAESFSSQPATYAGGKRRARKSKGRKSGKKSRKSKRKGRKSRKTRRGRK